MNLLTSMTRYYVCDSCDRRWNVSRLEPAEADSAVSAS
jgi:hypothetical protein